MHRETIHDWMCKIYDKDRVMVGTTARRFTMNVPADETSWVATRLRADASLSSGSWRMRRSCLSAEPEAGAPLDAVSCRRRSENFFVPKLIFY